MAWGGFKNQNQSPKNSRTWDPFAGIRKGGGGVGLSGVPTGGARGNVIEDNHGRPKTVSGVNKQQTQILEDSVLGNAARKYGTNRVKGMS